MERALDPNLLTGALGDIGNLPTPAQLRQMIADAEVNAFFSRDLKMPAELIETGWVLHQVGTVRPQLGLYDATQQVQANSVAAHIFDMALAQGLDVGDQLVTTFAAQVSSIRGDRTPNATALARRLPRAGASVAQDPGRASLELGCSLLSLRRAETFLILRRLEAELALRAPIDLNARLTGTSLSAAAAVVRGCRLLLSYLDQGSPDALEQARVAFAGGSADPASRRDLDSRWVAAHLLDLTDDLGQSSVWSVLPDGTPPEVGRAMTLGEPPVMVLWPPQISLLKDVEHSPLRPEVRRSVLTFPTSAGKTLLSQIIVLHHIETVGTPVCVVAPSHSLCREIREGLDRRLWVLRRDVVDDGPLGDPANAQAAVVVMTPEKLAARLRASSTDLLAEFGLFVLDEAHLVGDDTRGWTFETTISRLHELTAQTEHRLVVVSAALGGTATVRTWLDAAETPQVSQARWRGPRRLHATYETYEQGPVTTQPAVPPQILDRQVQDMVGVISLYADAGAAVAKHEEKVGEVVSWGATTKKPRKEEQLSLVVEMAAKSGPVLTVHMSKAGAEKLAAKLSSDRDAREPTSLVRLAELRLGPTHPLVDVLQRGIAYHHAALPVDIQIEIENAVRSHEIDIVCATTTLTEGVNLPFRTVVIADRGYFESGYQYNEVIDDPGLLNAAGRAGRAGRETEGWVVIAQENGRPPARQALLGLDVETDVRSTLNSTSALIALGEYETLVANTGGVLLAHVPPEVDAFLGYCWYLAEASAALDPAVRRDEVVAGLRRTLAWQQLPDHLTARWEALAGKLAASFEVTDAARRRRWAQSGTRLSANMVLERVAVAAAPAAVALDEAEVSDPLRVLEVLLSGSNLDDLLSLVPDRDHRFKKKRSGQIELLPVDKRALVLDWISGVDLAVLADTHLADVEGADAEAFRFEQLSVFLARVCEHHLPWTLGIVSGWIGQQYGLELCPSLPAHLHHGVPGAAALSLMRRGVRSRRLAVVVGNRADALGVSPDHLAAWLGQTGVAAWRSDFEAAPGELADLLKFVRIPGTGIGRALSGGAEVSVQSRILATGPVDGLRVRYQPGVDDPAPLVALDAASEVVAEVHPSFHTDLAMLIDTGFSLAGRVAVDVDGYLWLRLRLEVE
jgi:hypothetical protein